MLALERVRNPSKDRQKMEEKEDMVTMSSAGLKGGKEDASASTRSAIISSLSPAKATIWSTTLSSLKSARLRSRLQSVGTARKWSRMGKTLASCKWIEVHGELRDNYKTLDMVEVTKNETPKYEDRAGKKYQNGAQSTCKNSPHNLASSHSGS